MAVTGPLVAAQTNSVPPNIVLILTDDQGWWDLGANGNPHVATPNLDKLASEGVRFTHFHCSPVCAPTRAALLTGRHYQRTGAIDTFKGRDTLDAGEVTIANLLQRRGYKTACVGKWHLGRYRKYHPAKRGFDEFFGFWQYGFINDYDDSAQLFEGMEPVETTGYVTDVLTDRAISFIERNRANPFFVYLTYNAPHVPPLVPDRYIEPYLAKGIPLGEARTYGMVSSIDENIAKLLKTVPENTLVIFMSDNGGIGKHHRAGLRGAKGSTYEGGVRVPFLARWPGRFPAGAVVDAPAQHIDIFPTLCEITGCPVPSDRKIDGRSIAALLRAGKGESPHEFLYHQWNRTKPVLKTVTGDPDLKASWAIRNRQGLKLHSSGELFDLHADPSESKDLASQDPQAASALRREFERWFAEVTARDYQRVPIEVGHPEENPVEIDLTWGEPSGSVVPQYRSYNRDTLDKWASESDSVRWKLEVVEPGEYEWILSYGCGPAQAGSKVKIQLDGAKAEYTFRPTSGPMVFATRSAGTLKLQRGQQTLELRAANLAGRQMATIHKIWFRRITA